MQLNKRGWRENEPEEPPMEYPQVLPQVVQLLEEADLSRGTYRREACTCTRPISSNCCCCEALDDLPEGCSGQPLTIWRGRDEADGRDTVRAR
jgi:hypothetical protein